MALYTIGTGGDYATVAAFIAAVAVLTEDTTLHLISDVVEVGLVSFSGYSQGYALHVYGDGFKNTTWDIGGSNIQCSPAGAGINIGSVEIDNLRIEDTVVYIQPSNSTAQYSVSIHNNYFYNARVFTQIVGGGAPAGNWTFSSNLFEMNNAQRVVEINNAPSVGALNIENNSLWGGTTAIYSQILWGVLFRNNIIMNTTLTAFYKPIGVDTMEYYSNADDDDSWPDHAGVIHNIVPADEFESIVAGDAQFLHLYDGSIVVGGAGVPAGGKAPLKVQFQDQTDYSFPSDLGDGGAVSQFAVNDLDGFPIPTDANAYPIGCYGAQVPAPTRS